MQIRDRFTNRILSIDHATCIPFASERGQCHRHCDESCPFLIVWCVEIVKVLLKSGVPIFQSVIRSLGSFAWIDKNDSSLTYSGRQRRTGLYGTGIKNIRMTILEFEAINENISIVSV